MRSLARKKRTKKAPQEEGKEKLETPVEEETPKEKNDEAGEVDVKEGGETSEASEPAGKADSRNQIMTNFPKFVERDYSYEELATRLFDLIQRPEEKTTVKIKIPVVQKSGSRKTAWVNFPQICTNIDRQPEHVMQFFLAEVANTGSIDGNGRLIMTGRYQPKQIERLLRSYILEYVQCRTCKSLETKLEKENRLLFMRCDTCGSKRSVAQVKQGFQAAPKTLRFRAAMYRPRFPSSKHQQTARCPTITSKKLPKVSLRTTMASTSMK